MICVDNNFLVLLIQPDLNPPNDLNTNAPTERVPERLQLLQETWEKNGEVILIPDPALAEFLMFADEDADRLYHLKSFRTTPSFELKPFDSTIAIELAAMYIREKRDMSVGKRKEFKSHGTKTHMSFDRQIVAIAKFHEVSAIYSDDKGVKAFGDIHGVKVVRTFELPLPPDPEPEPEVVEEQAKFIFDEPLADGNVKTSDSVEVALADKPKATAEGGSDENDS